jgi:hypothetical protein
MFMSLQIAEAEALMHQAEDERRAALRATGTAVATAHRQRAIEHEIAAYRTCGSLPDLPVFDEAAFLRFVMKAACPPTSA